MSITAICRSASPSTPTKARGTRKRASPTKKAKSPDAKPRKSRRQYDFSVEFLAQFFHLPQRQAANLIGVAVITIKRNCKRRGIKWPYRANKYKAGNRPVLSDKGRAFALLPLACLAEMVRLEQEAKPKTEAMEDVASGCETDTESVDVDNDDQTKKDMCDILFSLHSAPSMCRM
jgi:hypothetical protein